MNERKREKPNRYWSKEEKLRIINKIIKEHQSYIGICKTEKISSSQLHKWIHQYLDGGVNNLENQKKPGNPLMKYSKRHQLSDVEKIEYENMKLRIEIERLKKGYQVKGVGQEKEYISINKKSMK